MSEEQDGLRVLKLLAVALDTYADQRDIGGEPLPAHLTPDPRQTAKIIRKAIDLLERAT